MFVVFEGPKGVGKSSTIAGVAAALQQRGIPAVREVEPTTSEIGQLIRKVVNDVAPRTLALLVAADRSHHQERIATLSATGTVVLCDRYVLSSLALQVVDGLEEKWVLELNRSFIQPDVCFVLSAPSQVIENRRRGRGQPMDRFGSAGHLALELRSVAGAASKLRDEGWWIEEVDADRPSSDVILDIVDRIERRVQIAA